MVDVMTWLTATEWLYHMKTNTFRLSWSKYPLSSWCMTHHQTCNRQEQHDGWKQCSRNCLPFQTTCFHIPGFQWSSFSIFSIVRNMLQIRVCRFVLFLSWQLYCLSFFWQWYCLSCFWQLYCLSCFQPLYCLSFFWQLYCLSCFWQLYCLSCFWQLYCLSCFWQLYCLSTFELLYLITTFGIFKLFVLPHDV